MTFKTMVHNQTIKKSCQKMESCIMCTYWYFFGFRKDSWQRRV